MNPPSTPRATARLQFHAGYTLDDAVAQVPYFAALGVSHLYASPLLAARAGSKHGYDGTDPTRVNPELGGEPALRRLVAELRRHGLGLILDIVPNHLAASTQNPWWADVLAWGLRSRHAGWFDIDWSPPDPALQGKVLLPVLGRPYGEALAAGELSLVLDAGNGRLQLAYFEHRFPLSAQVHAELLDFLPLDLPAFVEAEPTSGPARRSSVRAEPTAVRAEPLSVRAEPVEALYANLRGSDPLSRQGPFDKLRVNGEGARTGPPSVRAEPLSVRAEPVEALYANPRGSDPLSRHGPFDKLRVNGRGERTGPPSVRAEPLSVRAEPVEALYANPRGSDPLSRHGPFDKLRVNGRGERTEPPSVRAEPVEALVFEAACAALAQAIAADDTLRQSIESRLQRESADHAALHALLERQHYRLAWWRTASDEINWRRFFDVHELVGMNTERPEVFDALHATLLRLVQEGLVDGLRVDHVDGLADPGAYCRRLREAVERRRPRDASQAPFYLVVEKILCGGEALRADWSVQGSTGYDFMNQVNEWLHHPEGEAPLGALWAEVSGRGAAFEPEALAARRELLARSFSAQLESTVSALHAVARGHPASRDTSAASIRRALAELLVHFPVYRTYAWPQGRGDAADEAAMRQAVAGARRTCRREDVPVLGLLAGWLGSGPDEAGALHHESDLLRDLRRAAIRRFEQLTAPLAAKAVEDTAFYRHGRLLSRNDVGFDPEVFAGDDAGFHRLCEERQRHFPLAMLASATHDHKRGEDLRARLAVLSECPADWRLQVLRWRGLNDALRGAGAAAPSPGDELMLYQVLLGAWPIGLSCDDAPGLSALRERVWQWQEKALHEAKLATDWIAPDPAYENACKSFLEGLLDPARSATFLAELQGWAERVGEPGMRNGLLQTLLKYTVPGVPDLYQGTEYWDLSLVDPDNRRPVDFTARAASLDRVRGRPLGDLMAAWRDGTVKQALIHRLLACRAAAPGLFAEGDYRPLRAQGPQAGRLIAFERRWGEQRLLVVAARWSSSLPVAEQSTDFWRGTRLAFDADGEHLAWRDVLSGGPSLPPGSGGATALQDLLPSPGAFTVRAAL